MRSLALFVAGVAVGAAIQTAGAQAPPNQPAIRLNHVAIAAAECITDVRRQHRQYGTDAQESQKSGQNQSPEAPAEAAGGNFHYFQLY